MPDKKLPGKEYNNWTIIKTLSWTTSYFKDHEIDSPRLTAEMLLAHSLDTERLSLYLQFDRPLHKNELTRFKALIKRRLAKEPVAYITGEKGFFESDFEVAPGVLIPRPDTETLVEEALKILNTQKDRRAFKTVLELGTGSGAIIVSLAKAASDHQYFAGDISLKALAIAHANAEKIAPGKIDFFSGSWFSTLKQSLQFDLIVSNPPYIPTDDIRGLQPEITQFEPLLALDGGTDGLDSYRAILKHAHHYLSPGGALLLEMGFDQKAGVLNITGQYPQYHSIEFIKDLAGHDRVVLIKKSID